MDAALLFSGLHFDKKRFSSTVQRFNSKARDSAEPAATHSGETDLSVDGPAGEDTGSLPAREHVLKTPASKRRKKGGSIISDAASAFNLFQPPGYVTFDELPSSDIKDDNTRGKLAEAVSVLRKRCRLHVAGQNVPPPLDSFDDLKRKNGYRCKSYLRRNVIESGYTEPTPIQRQAVPVLLARRDCLACAPTGSGKTLAFMLPVLMNLQGSRSEGIRSLILCPTRELAAQTAREFRRVAVGSKLRIRSLTQALCRNPDLSKIPCDVLVSTPRRLQRLLKEEKINLSSVEYLVMDESDKLFELGFMEQIDSVVEACSSLNISRALFSATLPDTVEELARSIMIDPVRIVVGEKNAAASTVEQRLVFVGSEDGKMLALRQIFKESLRPPILLFVETKERAKDLHRELAIDGLRVDSIHADRSQAQRDAAVEKFREGRTWVLVATDLLARGMDFKGINCVVNYDFPQSTATYIHRIGRSGRAGRPGLAITLYTEKDAPYLRAVANIMRNSGCKVPDWVIALPKAQRRKRSVLPRTRKGSRPGSVTRKSGKRNAKLDLEE